MLILLNYLLIGVMAGILSGLLGVGGGIIVVPCLVFLFKYMGVFTEDLIMHVAVGTSLAIMMFTSSSSASAYYRRGLIVWPLFLKVVPGLCVGMIVGAFFAKQLSSNTLIILFSIFLVLIAIYIFFSTPHDEKEAPSRSEKKFVSSLMKQPLKLPNELYLVLVSIFIGLLSTTFGIGGGLLMIPFFLLLGFNMRQSSGTTSLCAIPIAIIGTIILILSGSTNMSASVPPGTTGFVYWPAVGLVSLASVVFAPIGTRLSLKSRQKTLRRLLSILLIISAVNLLFISLT